MEARIDSERSCVRGRLKRLSAVTDWAKEMAEREGRRFSVRVWHFASIDGSCIEASVESTTDAAASK